MLRHWLFMAASLTSKTLRYLPTVRVSHMHAPKATLGSFSSPQSQTAIIRYVRVPDEKLRSVEWADDDNVMIITSLTGRLYGFRQETSTLRVYNVSKNELKQLPGFIPGNDNRVPSIVLGDVMVRHVDGHTVLFVPGVDDWEGFVLVRCDITSGGNRIESVSKSDDTTWLMDANGRLAAQQDYDSRAQHWSISVYRGGRLHEAASGHGGLDLPQMLGFGPTADTVLVYTVENGRSNWKLLSINDGKLGDRWTAAPSTGPYLTH